MTQARKLRFSFDADENDWDYSSILEATSSNQSKERATPQSNISWIERVVGMVDSMTICCASPSSATMDTTVDTQREIFRRSSKPINIERCGADRSHETRDNRLISRSDKLSMFKSRPLQMSPPPLSKAVSVISDSTQKWYNITNNRSSTPLLTHCDTASTASLSIIDSDSDDDDSSTDSARAILIPSSIIEKHENWNVERDHDDNEDDDTDDGILFEMDHSQDIFINKSGMKKSTESQQQLDYLMKKNISTSQNFGLLRKSMPLLSTSSSDCSLDNRYDLPLIYSRDCLDYVNRRQRFGTTLVHQ